MQQNTPLLWHIYPTVNSIVEGHLIIKPLLSIFLLLISEYATRLLRHCSREFSSLTYEHCDTGVMLS